MKLKISKGLLAIATVTLMLSLSIIPALADHDLGLFELDRNATDAVGGGDDWAILHAGGGGAAEFTGIIEDTMGTNPLGSVGTQFQAGGSKDDLDISPGGATGQHWKWDPGEPLDKDDITNAYAAAYVNTVDTGNNNIGDLIVYFGLDRFANNGSAQVGFWFLQDPTFGLTTTPSGGGYLFSGHHVIGDVLVQSNFTQGGVIDTISVYEWVGAGGSNGTLNLLFNAQDCLTPGLSDDPACATVNQGDTISPWPFTPKFGVAGTFPQGSFFEGGINITRLVPDAGCFTGFLAETRSSTPFDARLKDFAFGNFELCSIAVTKTGDTVSKVGDDVDYSITVENTGAITLYKDEISDSLLGDLTGDAGCGASLAPGVTCTINVSRTVQAGDSDPLPNTVTATYNNKADFTGTAVSDSDSHSVNLFQPSISFDKSADATLSKEGDTVNYTLTLDNTSSGDSPNLTCTISDPTLGVDEMVNLAAGGQHVINKAQVMPAAPDPYVNTASVACKVDGFGNPLNAAIAATKTGDALGKVTDPVDYIITLSNNSSADTPAMRCTAIDSLLGEVFSGVLPLGDTVINTSRIVQEGDPDPLVNTVTLTCSPDGFPNVLETSASHSTNLFQPAVEVTKTGPDMATIGETITYHFTINNLSSADSPDLILVSVTDTVLGDLTAAASAAGCDTLASGSSCGFTFDYTIQATDPNPLVNIVTIHYNPEGFPNDITDFDEHSLILPSFACTPGFWQGGNGALLWDDGPPDADWTASAAEGDNPFIHTTLFNDYFNLVTDSQLAGYDMITLVSNQANPKNSATRAARDMVAAYLNGSAAPSSFGITLGDLLTFWYATVTDGSDAAYDNFHTTIAPLNQEDNINTFCTLP